MGVSDNGYRYITSVFDVFLRGIWAPYCYEVGRPVKRRELWMLFVYKVYLFVYKVYQTLSLIKVRFIISVMQKAAHVLRMQHE